MLLQPAIATLLWQCCLATGLLGFPEPCMCVAAVSHVSWMQEATQTSCDLMPDVQALFF